MGNIVKAEVTAFVGHLRVKDDLKQKIPQLIFESGQVLPRDGVSHLIGFFDCVGRDGLKILL
jgi:hypothetical protein